MGRCQCRRDVFRTPQTTYVQTPMVTSSVKPSGPDMLVKSRNETNQHGTSMR